MLCTGRFCRRIFDGWEVPELKMSEWLSLESRGPTSHEYLVTVLCGSLFSRSRFFHALFLQLLTMA
jgi:hypothetical protein